MGDRLRALRSWGARQGERIGRAAKWSAGRMQGWPWRRMTLWAGGAVGVLAATLALFISFADWNAFKGPIARAASAASGREIIITGDLDVHPWSWTPVIHVRGLKIGNLSRYRQRGAFADVRDAEAGVRLLPLLFGRFDIVRLDLNGANVALYRSAAGDANWRSDPGVGRGRALSLPAIHRFSLRDGHLRFQDDQRHMLLDAAFTTSDSADPANPGRFELDGQGRINNRPFSIVLTGAPLINVRRDRPYAFVADMHAGATRIQADGAIARPFDFNAWRADVIASGPDLADLYELTGLTLPNTPPYALRGRLERRGVRFAMPHVAGRVGDSDLNGAFTATRRGNGRLFLDGDFRSRQLDFGDLLTVLGAPDTRETASTAQRAAAANLAAQGRILPDAKLDISRVRNMDARVSYRAAHVRSDRFPLRSLAVDVNLDHGLLRLNPVTLDLRQGRLGGAVALNARQAVPRVDVDMRLSGARLESVLATGANPPLTGALSGRAQLSGAGASVREAAAHANGAISFATPSGEVRAALAELTGINVTRGLGLLLAKDQSKINIRCGVASFRVDNGVAHSRSILVDTETVLIGGRGSIDLRDETLDLQLQGKPKEVRLIRVAAPITLQGPWRSPHLGVEAGKAARQAGIGAALAALVAPLAVVLPFIDLGLTKDADCRALLAERPQPTRQG